MKLAIKVVVVLAVVLLICAWSPNVWAQERIRHESTEQFQEALGLTETQVAAIRAEQEAAGVRTHDLRVQVQQFDEQIYQTAEETGDATTVGRLVLQKIALQKQIEAENTALRDRINAVLTPAQQDKVKQMKEANELSRGWEALLMGGEIQLRRHEGVPRSAGVPGGGRPHRQRAPEK